MLFNSLEFIIFFPIVVGLYFIISPKYRWILLLAASYYFYMCWNYKYIVLILFSTVVDYFAAIAMSKAKHKRTKRVFLIASLISNLGLLFFFKYFNFFSSSLNAAFDQFNLFYNVPYYDFLLPVGISFYTFQTLSYTIDVYRNKQKPEYHFGRFALFVSFFPQLVAGPIERSVNLLPQFSQTFKFDYARIRDGIILMTWGMFKKVVIADRVSEYVNEVFNHPHTYDGLHNILATLFFSFQIYCDFSGYSDVAIGAALVMGYQLMKNFNRPYLAKSIGEFWSRWHISLSTWFRDYVYIPLGGNRVSMSRLLFNLYITFLISGLWHGANWTFVIWGALHGLYLITERVTTRYRKKIKTHFDQIHLQGLLNLMQIAITFILVYVAWIFFRANSVSDTFLIIKNLFVFNNNIDINLFQYKADFYLSLIFVTGLVVFEIFSEYFGLVKKIKKQHFFIKLTLYLVMIFIIVALGKWEGSDFIYFQF